MLLFSNFGSSNRFDSLIEYMTDELEFEKNNYNTLKQSDLFEKQRYERPSVTYKNFPTNLLKAQKILDRIKTYNETGLYPNVLLSHVFEHRFYMLFEAQKDIIKDVTLIKNNQVQRFATCVDGISSDQLKRVKDVETSDAQWSFIITKTSLDRFQLYNLFIKEMLWDMKVKGLSLTKENALWLQCARTLHPFLDGRVEILEKPETAFAINVDCNYDQSYKTEMDLSGHYFVKRIFGKEAVCSLGAKDSSFKAKPSLIDQMVDGASSFLSGKNSVVRWVSNHELLQLSETELSILSPEMRPTEPTLPPFSFPADLGAFSSSETAKISQPNENEVEKDDLGDLDDLKVTTPHSEVLTDDNDQQEYYDNLAKSEHKRFQAQKKSLVQPIEVVSKAELDQFNNTKQWLQSRLKLDDIMWLKTLFENQYKTVQYRRFASVWQSLCGKKSIMPSKKGSSHFALLNLQGVVIGGIFTHGPGQEYWDKAVYDLKNHFIALGITKEHLQD